MRSLADEYLDLDPLRVRLEAHRRYSEQPEDPEAEVVREAAISPGDAVLDVGSGTGAFLGRLRAEGHLGRLVAVDSSPTAVEATRVVIDDAYLGDAAALPFEDSTFDVVTARHMLFHVDRPEQAIAEARRVLVPGGRFVATVNHPGGTPYISAIVREAVIQAGIEPPVTPNSKVNSGNLPELVREEFGSVIEYRHDSALVFTDPRPLIRFGHSLLGFYGVPRDSPARPDICTTITAAVDRRFTTLEGPWRDPKGYIICSAAKV